MVSAAGTAVDGVPDAAVGDGSGMAVVVGLACEIVVLAGPDAGPLDVQATVNASNGTPMLSTARARRRPRLELWKPDLIVTEGATIRSSIAPRRPGRPLRDRYREAQLAAALLPPDEPPAPDDELPDDEPLDEPLPDEPLPELDGFDPPDESPDPPEPVDAATFFSLLSPDFSPPAGLSPDPLDGAVLVAAALESVR